MLIERQSPPPGGVTTLMYVGDDGSGLPETIDGYKTRPMLVAAGGAALALFSKRPLLRIAGAIAAWVGYQQGKP